ncbi:MAG: PQQ-binding-like beta-propeller repeat protein, partial [Planctomycetales bacterium]|nr:PQQ-binding-like beta-propeller repeat protein [Planctomycetales bacterium]
MGLFRTALPRSASPLQTATLLVRLQRNALWELRRLLNPLPAVATLVAVLIVAAWCQPPPANAQIDDDGSLNQIIMLAPREYQQQLKQAESAIERGEFSDAIQILAQLVAPPEAAAAVETDRPLEDFFIGRPSDALLNQSLRSEASRLIHELPPAGKELYRLQYGAIAQQKLQAAVANHDDKQLSDVAWRYFDTEAGMRACLLLGRHELDIGHPVAASIFLLRLYDVTDARRQFDPQLSVLLACSFRAAGFEPKAVEILDELRRTQPSSELVIAGERVALPRGDASSRDWLARYFPVSEQAGIRAPSEWTIHRGLATRNPIANGGMPLSRYRWRVPVANNPDDEELIAALESDFQDQDAARVPSITPLVVGDVLIMRTTDQLLGIDVPSGKRIWEYPWAEPLSFNEGDDTTPARNRQQRKGQLEERIWKDSAYGQLASDGRQVFLLDELSYVSPNTLGQEQQMFRQFATNDDGLPKNNNYLVSLDIETEGKYRWRVGGDTGEDEPQLAGVFFLGAPLPLSGELYVLGELHGDINLFVLDAATGQLRWTQLLAHVGPISVIHDYPRRLAGASPAFSDGVLVCPTSAGAIVAIDLATRSLRWGYQYPRPILQGQRNINFIQNRLIRAASNGTGRERWLDANPVIGSGCVVLSAVEADELICLDLLTGERRWQKERESLLYVACIDNGIAMVVGSDSVVGFDLTTGDRRWELPLNGSGEGQQRNELTAGQGFLTPDHQYFLPTSRRLIKIEVATGLINAEQATPEPLGNLVGLRDQLMSLTPTTVSSYYQADSLQKEVTQRLDAKPLDPWALEHQGLLLLERNKPREAMVSLNKALQGYDVNDGRRVAVQALLFDTLLSVVESSDEPRSDDLQQLEQLIDTPRQQDLFARLQGQRLRLAGQNTKAVQAYLSLLEYATGGPNGIVDEGRVWDYMESSDRRHAIRRDQFAHAGIRRAMDEASVSQREEIEQLIRVEQQTALASDSSAPLSRFVRLFDGHPLCGEVRLALANRQLAAGNLLAAEFAVGPLAFDSDSTTSGNAWVMLGRIMKAAHRDQQVLQCADHLEANWSDQPLDGGKTGSQWSHTLRGMDANAVVPLVWPYGRIKVNETKPPVGTPFLTLRPIAMESAAGPLDVKLQAYYDASMTNAVIINDALNKTVAQLPSTTARIRKLVEDSLTAQSLGHLVVINNGFGIGVANGFSTDADISSGLLWPDTYLETLANGDARANPMQVRTSPNPWGQNQTSVSGRRVQQVGPLSYGGLVYLQTTDLRCVDPLSGDLLWMQRDIPAKSRLWGDDEWVLVAPAGETKARVFSMLDGREAAEVSVPGEEAHWNSWGRCVLTWDDIVYAQPRRRLRLYDPLTKTNRWSREYPTSTRGHLTVDGTLALVDGAQATLLDTRTGDVLFELALE